MHSNNLCCQGREKAANKNVDDRTSALVKFPISLYHSAIDFKNFLPCYSGKFKLTINSQRYENSSGSSSLDYPKLDNHFLPSTEGKKKIAKPFTLI